MAGITLRDYQLDAVKKMKNGCILCGGVGSGKSRTALAYYYVKQGGSINSDDYVPMSDPPQDLYIITTARKRDTLEWDGELPLFLMSSSSDDGLYGHQVVIDSWNNIKKYAEVKNAFFIFDEQRVVGRGTWVEAFIRIARNNDWILLSATPGDTWQDYIPVFVANGFYKNRSEFINEHIVYSRFSKFPKVDRYLNTGRLIRLRRNILVDMDFKRETIAHHSDISTTYDKDLYKSVMKTRWNPYTEKPIVNASEFCHVLRKITNESESRQATLLQLLEKHPKMIVFYNFDYELDILRSLDFGEAELGEWNGHKHEPIPTGTSWVYLVQYTAGSEGWNCINTDTIVFFSMNYSYKIMTQAAGRIDRLNTPYSDLYYYHLKSESGIDKAINKAYQDKKKFNETKFCNFG